MVDVCWGVKGNTVALISWNAACQNAGSTGTEPNSCAPPPHSPPAPPPPPSALTPLSHECHVPLPVPPLSSPSRETGEPPSPLPATGSAVTLLRPLDGRHSCPPAPAAVAVRLLRLSVQNRSVTSERLLEYSDFPRIKRTQGGIRACTGA